jgi:outer membrane lipoprotein-sorting protein
MVAHLVATPDLPSAVIILWNLILFSIFVVAIAQTALSPPSASKSMPAKKLLSLEARKVQQMQSLQDGPFCQAE